MPEHDRFVIAPDVEGLYKTHEHEPMFHVYFSFVTKTAADTARIIMNHIPGRGRVKVVDLDAEP